MERRTDQTLTPADAARYLGISPHTLAASRLNPPRTDGPPFVRYTRSVRYRVADLDAWLLARRVVPGGMAVGSGPWGSARTTDGEAVTQ